jgi:hypothetical protein
MKNELPALLEAALEAAKNPPKKSIGDLCLEIANQLPAGTAIRVTNKGIRVTNSRYFDRLRTPTDINAAIKQGAFA